MPGMHLIISHITLIVNNFAAAKAVGLFSIKKQRFDSDFLIDKSRAEWYNIPILPPPKGTNK